MVSFSMVTWLAFPWCLVKTVKQVKPYTHHIPRLRNITTKPESGVESSGQKTLMKPRDHWVNLFSLSFLDWLVVVCGEPRKGTKVENENVSMVDMWWIYILRFHFPRRIAATTETINSSLGVQPGPFLPKANTVQMARAFFKGVGWMDNGEHPKCPNLVVPRAK